MCTLASGVFVGSSNPFISWLNHFFWLAEWASDHVTYLWLIWVKNINLANYKLKFQIDMAIVPAQPSSFIHNICFKPTTLSRECIVKDTHESKNRSSTRGKRTNEKKRGKYLSSDCRVGCSFFFWFVFFCREGKFLTGTFKECFLKLFFSGVTWCFLNEREKSG